MILIGNSNFSWSKQVMYLLFRYFNFSVLVLFYHFLSCSALSFCNLTLLCPVPSSFWSTPRLLTGFFFSDLVCEQQDESFSHMSLFFFLFSLHMALSLAFYLLFFSFLSMLACAAMLLLMTWLHAWLVEDGDYWWLDDLIACLDRWWWLLWLLDGLMNWLNGFTDSLGLNLRLETTGGQKCSFNAVNFLKMLVFNLGAMSHDQWRTVFNGSSWCSILNHVSVVVRQ